MKKCQHCGKRIRAKRFRIFCSIFCEKEHHADSLANHQRINSFQALADAGSWLAIDNITVYVLADPSRKVQLLEFRQFCLGNETLNSYRLTKAGHKLLNRWKSQLQVSV